MTMPMTMVAMRCLNRFALAGVMLALIVLALGVTTRLMDAGLGCPDWPGCYGHITVPSDLSAMQAQKAWAEMVHRYVAGTLAIVVMAVAFLSVFNAVQHGLRYLILGLLLFVLVIYQAILGMWTVTFQLVPWVVTQHLIGGMLLLGLLWLVYLSSRPPQTIWNVTMTMSRFKTATTVGLCLVLLQIFLGAWTSTHYASLSCTALPWCTANGPWFSMDFAHAFDIFSGLGVGANYDGGVLGEAARKTIHMTHRLGAVLLTVYLLWFCIKTWQASPFLACTMLGLLLFQIILGTLNVLLSLPFITAVLHNMVAALLWLVMMTYHFRAWVGASR